jgi:hypothetical protein
LLKKSRRWSMRIEYALNPNCSEAVFRFYTLEPEKIQQILQALADEIDASTEFKSKTRRAAQGPENPLVQAGRGLCHGLQAQER